MEKSNRKSRYRLFGKITTLFAEINEELSCTGMKLCINSEYAPEYLKEAAEQYAEVWQINEAMFVHGRGHRKTTQNFIIAFLWGKGNYTLFYAFALSKTLAKCRKKWHNF